MDQDAADASRHHKPTTRSMRLSHESIPAKDKCDIGMSSAPGTPTASVVQWNNTTPTTTPPTKFINRTVHTRSQFRITLPMESIQPDQSHTPPIRGRGWSSPRALPYRPLGKPDLNMKLSPNVRSPNVRSPNVRNESQAKCVELRQHETTNSTAQKNSAAIVEDGCGLKTHAQLPVYSPVHIKHLSCPAKIQNDPSFAILQQVIRDCSTRVCSVKYGASAFSRSSIPRSLNDLIRTDKAEEDQIYLPYTSRIPQPPPHRPLPTFKEYLAEHDRSLASQAISMKSSHVLNDGHTFGMAGHHRSPVTTRSAELVQPEAKATKFVDQLSKSLDGVVKPTSHIHSTNYHPPNSELPSTNNPSVNTGTGTTSPTREHALHGIERLQLAINSRNAIKHTFSANLLTILQSLEHGRWTCFCLKFANFQFNQNLSIALFQMNELSEAERQMRIENALSITLPWFSSLLALVAKVTVSGQPPPSACSFAIDTIRKVVNEGHEFQTAVLCSIVLCLTVDELQLDSTQALLKFLRNVVKLSLEDWERFFLGGKLPLPREVLEMRVNKETAARKRSKMNFAKIKHVIRTKGMIDTMVKPRLQTIQRLPPAKEIGSV